MPCRSFRLLKWADDITDIKSILLGQVMDVQIADATKTTLYGDPAILNLN